MQHATTHQQPRMRPVGKNTKPIVCVVDSRAEACAAWDRLSESAEVRTVHSASMALRQARQEPIDLWIIRAELPDMSGPELCGMIRNLSPRAAVCIVADEYSECVERAAWQARATMFECGPLDLSRIEAWLEHWRGKQWIAAGRS